MKPGKESVNVLKYLTFSLFFKCKQTFNYYEFINNMNSYGWEKFCSITLMINLQHNFMREEMSASFVSTHWLSMWREDKAEKKKPTKSTFVK